MERITTILRQARETKGVSLKDAEVTTRIPLKYLQALEGETKNGLLADEMYLVPFLRAYANFLGIDANRAVTCFLAEAQRGNMASTALPQRRMAVRENLSIPSRLAAWVVPFSLLLVVLFVGSYLWQHGFFTDLTAWQSAQVVSTEATETSAPAVLPAPSISAPESPPVLIGEPTTQTPAVEAPALPTTNTLPVVVSPSPTPQEATTTLPPSSVMAATTPSAAPTGTHGHHLSIHAREASWIRVVVDSQKKEDVTLQPGQTREWTAEQGFTLFLGNAGGVTLKLNGQELPPVGRSGQVVRNLALPVTQ